MDKFQHKLRWLIVTGSTVGFMGGWALLAHAGKPVSNTNTYVDDSPSFTPTTTQTTLQTTAPGKLPPIDFNAIEAGRGTTNLQPLPIVPDTQPAPVFRPRFRTRSS